MLLIFCRNRQEILQSLSSLRYLIFGELDVSFRVSNFKINSLQ